MGVAGLWVPIVDAKCYIYTLSKRTIFSELGHSAALISGSVTGSLDQHWYGNLYGCFNIFTTTNSPASSVQRSFIPTPPTVTAYSSRICSFSDELLHGVDVSIFTRLEESPVDYVVTHLARRGNAPRST